MPARTPGILGLNDQSDPNITSLLGDTPGLLGSLDGADPTLARYTFDDPFSETLCLSPDGVPLSIATISFDPPVESPSDADPAAYFSSDYSSTTVSVGDGYCVPLVQKLTNAPNTAQWTGGDHLKDRPALQPGTAIATFDEHNHYASNSKGNHAAIFVRYDPPDDPAKATGIVIYDQYREWADSPKNAGKDWDKKKPTEDDAAFKARKAEVEKNFPEVDPKHGRFRRKQPGERTIYFDAKKSPSNNAGAFSVILPVKQKKTPTQSTKRSP